MHGQFKPPDHSRGDEATIGGYMAVHDRPAAFAGSDGYSYSVEILTEETGDADAQWGAYFLFVRWARIGAQNPEGHLESAFVMTAPTEAEAREKIGALPLDAVKRLLDDLIAARPAPQSRAWWDAMREEGSE